jgi:hypothetical protein
VQLSPTTRRPTGVAKVSGGARGAPVITVCNRRAAAVVVDRRAGRGMIGRPSAPSVADADDHREMHDLCAQWLLSAEPRPEALVEAAGRLPPPGSLPDSPISCQRPSATAQRAGGGLTTLPGLSGAA